MNEMTQAADGSHDPGFLYEFDREPIPKSKLLGPGYFAGAYAGEHVAATEFVIGVTFVNWGASVQDIFLGLVVGNLLAVLTWTLVCAPIAVDTRLTLYWYLRKIGGSRLTSIYNLVNAFLYAIMAGCMITVSASAVRIPFGIPPQLNWYPTDFRFVLVVLGVGAVVVTLAILGFKKLATFATVCSPWMFLMFIVGALAVLPELFASSEGGTFFEIARQSVWTGTTPDGSEPMGFWKVAAFAWICNLGMHGALSDMALFRYARKASYGLFSSFGMFLGHYLAWICAGLMGAGAAMLMQRPLTTLDAGEVGYQALGWVGALAVVIAGWTTSNPTLYRVGLALQAVTPNWSRAKVTLVAGVATIGDRLLPIRIHGTTRLRRGLRTADLPHRCHRRDRALGFPANGSAPILGHAPGRHAELGGHARLGTVDGVRDRARTEWHAASVLPLPSRLRIRHGHILVPGQSHGGGRCRRCGASGSGRGRSTCPSPRSPRQSAANFPTGDPLRPDRGGGPRIVPLARVLPHRRTGRWLS